LLGIYLAEAENSYTGNQPEAFALLAPPLLEGKEKAR